MPPTVTRAHFGLAVGVLTAPKVPAPVDPRYDWAQVGRPSQQPPAGEWRTWLILAGRGYGKTRTGAEWVRGLAEAGTVARIALVGPTAADARDVMVEGESGLLAISPPHWRPTYEPSKRRLTWPNGVMATTYSADEPDRLRGPQHGAGWADEVGTWKHAETWDMLQFGMRLGTDPRQVVTTTPRPIKLLRDLIAQPSTVITRGATYENAENLAPAFLEQIVARYAGTRLGRQELQGELLDDLEGALWQRSRFDERKPAPDLQRVVVAVDPAATSGAASDETGIVVAGVGIDGLGYILADRSCRLSPDGWARRAIAAYDEFGADRVVVEVNNGGEMVSQTLQTIRPTLPITAVHASRGKQARAEPVAALYEQGRVWHTAPFDLLEDQLCGWTPASGQSPDRLDALVWALTDLLVDAPGPWAFL
ncbi:MAG TPA: terminase family protein [Hyphomicrobiaceae bacterium]|nr:terminase family protein [Hyphomicrobiaceae bacterium]